MSTLLRRRSWMFPAVALLGVIAGLSGGSGGAQLTSAEVEASDCPNGFEDLRHVVSWAGGRNGIVVEARSACGSRRANAYGLSDVSVRIESHGKVIGTARAMTGSYYVRQGRMLIEGSPGANGCLVPGAPVMIDLRTGEVRSPGVRLLLNQQGAVRCTQGSLHG